MIFLFISLRDIIYNTIHNIMKNRIVKESYCIDILCCVFQYSLPNYKNVDYDQMSQKTLLLCFSEKILQANALQFC